MILKELIVRIKSEGANDVKRQVDDVNRSLNSLSANERRVMQQFQQFQRQITPLMQMRGGFVGALVGDNTSIQKANVEVKNLSNNLLDLAQTALLINKPAAMNPATSFVQKMLGAQRMFSQGVIANLSNWMKENEQLLDAEDVADVDEVKSVLEQRIMRSQKIEKILEDYQKRPTLKSILFKKLKIFYQKDDLRQEKINEIFARAAIAVDFIAPTVVKGLQMVAFAATAATTAIAVYSKSLVDLGKSSIMAAVGSEDLNTRLLALTGSAEKAESMQKLFQAIAGPSAFTTQQIADAGVNLQAYGINVQRTLPLIAMLGQAFGASNEQLQMYVGFVARLKSGYLDETLGRLGITKADLGAKGIQFDAGGALKSSAEKTMVAIEEIIKSKYGRIFDLTKNNASTMAASIQDSFQVIQKEGGMVLLDVMKPLMSSFGQVVQAIADSGVAASIYENLYRPFFQFLGVLPDAPKSMAEVLINLIVMLEEFSNNVSRMMFKVQKDAIIMGAGGLPGLPDFLQPREAKIAVGVAEGLFAEFGPKSPNERKKELMKKIIPLLGKGGKGFPSGGNEDFFTGPGNNTKELQDINKKNSRNLERIANNTKKSADLMDLRRQTIGGGPLASLGLTGAELSRLGFNYRSDISMKGPMRPATGIERSMRELIRSEGYSARNGLIPIR